MYENWARRTKTGQLKSFGKNGIILNIRRSSGQSFYLLKVSKWATFQKNFRNFHLTDEKILRLQTKVYENWATHCSPSSVSQSVSQPSSHPARQQSTRNLSIFELLRYPSGNLQKGATSAKVSCFSFAAQRLLNEVAPP